MKFKKPEKFFFKKLFKGFLFDATIALSIVVAYFLIINLFFSGNTQ